MSDGDLPSYPHQRRAAAQIVTAQTFGKLGDLLANPKTTLTWLMQSIGAPPWLVGLLVPIRESGSMLPQLWLTGVVGTFSRRKWASAAGCLGQAIAGGIMAIAVRLSLPAGEAHGWVWPGLYFAFSVGYSGVRVGRKTYVVDVAGGDRRTAYVAASNTAIAVALLAFGAVGAALQTWSTVAAFGMFVGLTALGSLRALRLDDRAAPPG
jgi:hypothetical protein